jgi:ABC-type lipoprotein export system ATPase subunit
MAADLKLGEEEIVIPEDVMIACDELVKIYMSEGLKVMALQGLDLQIQRGEMMAIIGKSGSGKSTLLNMIGGLENPSAGRIFVGGRDLSSLKEKDMVHYRRQTVGFVWQKSSRNLFPYLTVLENVEAPMYFSKGQAKERRKRAMMLLEQVGMEKYAGKLPGQLSGGEQQRVAIAVALANQPEILLADEPTGAVDTKTSNQIFELFHKLNQEMGLTILIVTHDMSLAEKVERTVMISDGKISTEKIRKHTDQKEGKLTNIQFAGQENGTKAAHEEYSVLDKAHRVQLTEEMLEAAGIHTNKVRIEVIDGKVVISREENPS